MSLQAIRFDRPSLSVEVLDQLKLPHTTAYVRVETAKQAFDVIHRMVVRGAPAIAIVGMLGVAVDVARYSGDNVGAYAREQLRYVVGARPTAVNLGKAAAAIEQELAGTPDSAISARLLDLAEQMLRDDIADNRAIGQHGLGLVRQSASNKISVITICNTGSLATAGFGTALGIVRSLHEAGMLERVYALETRPYNQGARLTAYELVHDGIPATLVTDSMAAALMRQDSSIKLAVVGADRVAANGDTANKIGTYQLAVLAKHHGVQFVVAAPTTSIDYDTETGTGIVVEERPAVELTHINGQPIAAPGIEVWNPAFDVTPHELVTAIVSEKGVWDPRTQDTAPWASSRRN